MLYEKRGHSYTTVRPLYGTKISQSCLPAICGRRIRRHSTMPRMPKRQRQINPKVLLLLSSYSKRISTVAFLMHSKSALIRKEGNPNQRGTETLRSLFQYLNLSRGIFVFHEHLRCYIAARPRHSNATIQCRIPRTSVIRLTR